MNRLGDTPSCLLVNTRLNLWEQKPGCAGGQPLPRASVHPKRGLHISGTGKRGCSAELADGGQAPTFRCKVGSSQPKKSTFPESLPCAWQDPGHVTALQVSQI